MDMPQTGGSWIRDPETGALVRAEEYPAPAADVVDIPTEADDRAAAEPKRKTK